MCPPCQRAWGIPAVQADEAQARPAIENVIGHMEKLSPFAADASYTVSLPMTENDVIYNLELASQTAPADTLSDIDYLIRWTLPHEGTESNGFLAYFDGHHYRFRDNRLQEYHFGWDSIPFLTATGRVQKSGQFVDLLPQSVAADLRGMLSSDNYTMTIDTTATLRGKSVSRISATQDVQGYVGRVYNLYTDNATGLPLRIDNEFNPGQISEQSVTVEYSYPAHDASLRAVTSEAELMELYPEVFEKYRESNYRIENMRGLPMPAFSLPTLTGERYSRQKGDPFKAPAIIAVIDPKVASAAATVEALRKVQDNMPRQIDLIFAFMGSNTDMVEEIVGTPAYGETDLISAKSLARDCGTAVYPTILIIEPSGIITNVILGFNNSLEQDVIQSLALVK